MRGEGREEGEERGGEGEGRRRRVEWGGAKLRGKEETEEDEGGGKRAHL